MGATQAPPAKSICLAVSACFGHDHACPVQVVVHTSDVRGAGTDAEVLLELHGSKGNSGALGLPFDRSSFKRGAADTFHVLAPDCGELQELHVWHTGKVGAG